MSNTKHKLTIIALSSCVLALADQARDDAPSTPPSESPRELEEIIEEAAICAVTVSQEGVEALKQLEGFSAHAFDDHKQVSIGYGTRARSQSIDRLSATVDMLDHLETVEDTMSARVTVCLAQHEYDALALFAYNVGNGAFARSTLLEKVNARDTRGAVAEFGKWVYASGKVNEGLVKRRRIEAELFLKNVV